MHLLFPSAPFSKIAVDEEYAGEYEAARGAGLACSVFCTQDFEEGTFVPRPAFPMGSKVIYRGWMLTPEEYTRLHDGILSKGGGPVTNPAQYRLCHYLPEWYPQCMDCTPETLFLSRNADFALALSARTWPAYFVKDYVKSLTTKRGSVAATAAEVGEIVDLIEQFRGKVEGGVCIRKYEDLLPATEERYFVLNRRAYGRDSHVPPLVSELAERIESPFFSVDIVEASDGQLRLIELGDGQVSSLKRWPMKAFVGMLTEAA
jgi:hypothetical protein